MAEAPVTPEVVKWAIDESGMSIEELAERLKVGSTVVAAWTNGRDRPTKGQLTQLADKLKRPRAMFFLPAVPSSSSLPDGLRAAAGVRDEPSLGFRERLWIRRAQRLQNFVAGLVEDEVHVPAADQAEDAQAVAERLRKWVGVNWEVQSEWTNPYQAFRGWREAVEASGVAVLALPMQREGIRGFALRNPWLPVVAVNTADIHEARCFTLFHELAHLALGSDSSCAERNRGGTERWCDRVASHVLIPREQLMPASRLSHLGDLAVIQRAANRFNVSRRAAAIALEEVGAVTNGYRQVEVEWPSVDREKRGGGGGGGRTSPRKCIDEYGGLAVGALVAALDQGRIDELQVRDHLRLDSTQLAEASQMLAESSA